MPAASTQTVLGAFRAQPSLPPSFPGCLRGRGSSGSWHRLSSPRENLPSYLVLSSAGTKLRSSELAWSPSGTTEECPEGEHSSSRAQSPSQ